MPRKLLLIFLLALTVRVLFFSVTYEQSDQMSRAVVPSLDGYYEIAENLLHGNGFSQKAHPPFIPDSVRTPLYPLFLAALVFLFKSYYAVLLAQIILGSLIPLLAYRIANQILAHEYSAKIVALILAVEPLTIQLSVTLMSETFFTVLFLAGTTLFLDYMNERRGNVLAYATGLLSLATLARPTSQFLPFLLVGAVLFLAKRHIVPALWHSCIIAAVFLLVLAPWMVRNAVRFGNASLSVQYASVPYGYLIPSAIALEKHIGFEQAKREFYAGEGGIESVEDINLANAKDYKKRIVPILLQHPVGLVKSIGVTIFTFFTHDGYLDVLRRFGIESPIRLERPAFTLLLESPKEAITLAVSLSKGPMLVVILGRIVWIFTTLCFIFGAIRLLKKPEHRAKGVFVLLLIAYFVLTTVAVGLAVNARFRMPVNTLVLTLAAYGASGLFIWIKSHTHRDEKCN